MVPLSALLFRSSPGPNHPRSRGGRLLRAPAGQTPMSVILTGVILAGVLMAALGLAPPDAPAAESLRIGFVLGLSGLAAPEESDIQNGAVLAVEEHNAATGPDDPTITLTFHDTKNTPIGAKVAAEEAVFAGADLLLAPAYSSQTLEAARTAQDLGVPLISVIATHPDIAAVGDRVFSVCFDDHAQARAMAAFAHTTLGAGTAVILVDLTSAYGLAMAGAFRERFTALGGRIVAEIPYKMRQRNFDQQLRQVAEARSDVLFMPGYWVDGAVMVKRLEAFGITAVPLGGDGWGSWMFESRRGDSPRRGYYTDHWAAFMADEASVRFTKAYARRFGHAPVAGSALAYDAVGVAVLAAKRAGSARPEDLTSALASIRDFPGITGSITFQAGGKAQKDIHIMEIANGKARLLQTITPHEAP